MSPVPKSHPGPPNNPDLRELIRDKRHWEPKRNPEAAKRGFRGWHERGYLPHRDEPGLIQFVTFRLADSFPEALRSEWEHLLKIEDDREKRAGLEAYLDRGRGACWLSRRDVAELVEKNLYQFEGDRYELRAWVVMPNHVHVLFRVGDVSMSETVGAWKKHTGRLANRLIAKRGKFWAEDYFDTFMRDSEHERATVRYIEANPAKAGLVLDPKRWERSSAVLRNEFGVLKIT